MAASAPEDSMSAVLRRVCDAAAQALSASGVGVSVMTDHGIRGVYATTDAASERMEEAQFVLGEGPCVDAFTSRRPVLVADLVDGAAGRWPAYTAAALQDGVRAVFAFPLQIGAARLGVLDMFRRRAGPLDSRELPLALSFADLTVEAILNRQHAAHADGAVESPAAEIEHRAELFQAQGMVMVQLGVGLGEALVRMRAYAYAENRRLSEVACDVVERRLRFDRDSS